MVHWTEMGPLALALAFLAACGADPELPEATNADEMYSLDSFPSFYVELNEEAWNALEQEPKSYVSGRFRYGDHQFEHVGIRLKGTHTLTPIDEKPSFKIKLDKFVDDQRLFGLEEIMLHNMIKDRSMIHEALGYRVFRELGVPAPRTGYARVYVNDTYYGLYLNVEAYEDAFLEDRFVDPGGELYEGGNGSDVDEDPWKFEQDEGQDESREAFEAFAELATAPGDGVFFDSETMLDTDNFMAFTLAEALIGHFDGYRKSHNFFIYHQRSPDLWTWLPWSLDQTFVRELGPYSGEGYLTEKCMWLDSCREAYIVDSLESIETLDAINWSDYIDEIVYVTEFAASEDERKPYSDSSVESGREEVHAYLGRRLDAVHEDLDCLVDGRDPDEDDDGYGACYLDCDDSDPTLSPDQEEVCDGLDNDCSGFPDDITDCECPSETIEGVEFFFCSHTLRWTDAADFCEEQGHQLARFDSRSQNDRAAEIANDLADVRWAIGLDDRDTEQDFRWQDDTTPAFTAWASGEPSQQLEWFDCVFFSDSSSGTWVERNCLSVAPFVCSD